MTIKGKQIATGDFGVGTANLVDGVLSASADGRAKIQDGFFDADTVAAKFAAGAIAIDRLAELVLLADGSQSWTGDQDAGGNRLTNLGAPTQANDAATKAYVDAAITGLNLKASVRLATAAALPANSASGAGVGKTLTASANGALTVDGVAVVVDDRVLVKDEIAADDNGIYTVTAPGDGSTPFVLTRATDFDQDDEVTAGAFTFVTEGSTNADSGWVLISNNPIVVDTTELSFTQFSGAGQITAGAGLTKTGNTLDVGAGAGIQVNADDIEVIYGLVAAITSVEAGASADAGTEDSAARIDHVHDVSTAAPIELTAATTNSEGSSSALARSDHEHAVSTATAVRVGVISDPGSAASLARADHVHSMPAPTTEDKDLSPLDTTGDGAPTGIEISSTPALGGDVLVTVNGVLCSLGDGVKTAECYFSTDDGATALDIADITAGAELYWNGDIAGFDLSTSDRVSLFYEAFWDWTPLDAEGLVAYWDAGAESFPDHGIKGGYDLDGSTDHFARTSGAIPGVSEGAPQYPLTVVQWFKTDTVSAGTGTLFEVTDASTDSLYLQRFAAQVQIGAADSGATSTLTAASSVTAGRWHCVVAVWVSASSRAVYLDTDTTGATSSVTRAASGLTSLYVGRSFSGSAEHDGVIGPTWVLSGDLSGAGKATERAAIFNGADPATATGFTVLAHYKFDNDAGADSSGNGYDLTPSGSPTAQNNLIVLRDKSGGGYHLRATTAAPTWSASAFNNRGGVVYTNGLSQFLVCESAPVTAPPFQVYAVATRGSTTGGRGLFWLGDKDAANDYWSLEFEGSGTGLVRWLARALGTSSIAQSATTYSADTTHLLWGLEASATSRAVRLDGAGEGTDATSRSPATPDRVGIGAYLDSTPSNYHEGSVGAVVLLGTASVADRPNFHAYVNLAVEDGGFGLAVSGQSLAEFT